MRIRPAEPGDAEPLVTLIGELGYEVTGATVAAQLAVLLRSPPDRLLVACDDERVVGLIGCHALELLHIPGRLGRITVLVVAASHRRRGVGAELIAAAENHFRSMGCGRIEVTSGARRAEAHAFYTSLGFAETSKRFVKAL
jgi:GNAT superfamily N-acetyltransferase